MSLELVDGNFSLHKQIILSCIFFFTLDLTFINIYLNLIVKNKLVSESGEFEVDYIYFEQKNRLWRLDPGTSPWEVVRRIRSFQSEGDPPWSLDTGGGHEEWSLMSSLRGLLIRGFH